MGCQGSKQNVKEPSKIGDAGKTLLQKQGTADSEKDRNGDAVGDWCSDCLVPCREFMQSTFSCATPIQGVGKESAGDPEHLRLGCSVYLFVAFMEYLLGVVMSGFVKLEPNGYDVCKHIRACIAKNEWDKLSALEVLLGQKSPFVGIATVFFSHAQLETLEQTTMGLIRCAEKILDTSFWEVLFFLDYMTIRQCLAGDFFPSIVETTISNIGRVMVLLCPWHEPTTMKRAWCAFELSCALKNQVELLCVPQYGTIGPGMAQAMKNVAAEGVKIRIQDCGAREEKDKELILAHLESGFGIDKANSLLQDAIASALIKESDRLISMGFYGW